MKSLFVFALRHRVSSHLPIADLFRKTIALILCYATFGSTMQASAGDSGLHPQGETTWVTDRLPLPEALPALGSHGSLPGAVQTVKSEGARPKAATKRLLASLYPPLLTRSAKPMMQSGGGTSSGTYSSIAEDFNKTPIPGSSFIWFSSVLRIGGAGPNTPVRIFLRGSTVKFTANGVAYNISAPDANVIFSTTATKATTSYDPSRNLWTTVIPSTLNDYKFLTGVELPVPAGGLPAKIDPVIWDGYFYSDTAGVNVNWQWAAAVYKPFSTNLSDLGVKPVDVSTASQYLNNDRAGTPENFKPYVVAGARGSGGTDYTGAYAGTATITPVVQVPNYPPVANAGPAQTVHVADTVQLDGTGSTDRDGDPLTYRWTFTSLPAGSAAVLNGANTPKPTFVPDKPGSYVAQLIVNDGKVDSAPSTVTISTTNSAPVANAGPDQTAHVTDTVHLDGSKSTDVDGDPLTYQWTLATVPQGSNAQLSNATTVNPTFLVDAKGTYVAQLIVNDGQANSAPATVTISTVNTPPVANPGPPQKIIVGRTVNLDGSKSTDVDGDQLTFQWSLLSVPDGSSATLSNPTSVTPSFVPDKLGDYVVQLIVNDGAVDSQPATLTVTTENTTPIANAGPARTVQLGATVALDGSGSFDADGHSLTYHWSLTPPSGSNTALLNADTSTPSFIADLPGNYVAQLIVNDGFVNSAPATVVISTINSVPVSDVGPGQKVPTGTTVHLDGSGSSDADGDPLIYRWAITVKPEGSTATLSDTTVQKPTFVPDVEGTYVIQLIVNDGTVDSAPATVMVLVENPNQAPVVNAGPDQTITLPTDTTTLSGTVSDDGKPVGVPLKISWTQVSGPAPVAFSDASSAVTQATFTAVGDYVLRLTGDDSLLSSSDDVTVTVKPRPNDPPVVSAGSDQTVPFPNHLALQGRVTDDGKPEGGTLTATWSQVSGPSTAIFADIHDPHTVVTLNAEGVYKLQLTGDDSALQTSAFVTITTVKPGNLPPVVTVGPDQTIQLPTATAAITGSAVDDGFPSGSALTYSWKKVSGPGSVTFADPAAPNTTAVFSDIGSYVLRLTASDSELSGSASMRVTVLVPNQPPSVSAGPDQTITLPTNLVTLSGSASDDGFPLGSKLKTFWSVVSGPGPVLFGDLNSPVTTALFTVAGNYVLRLTADDSQYRSSDDVSVTILRDGVDRPPTIISQPTTQLRVDPFANAPQIQNLSGWQVIQYFPLEESQGAANWVLDSTKTVATQTLNADASILLSDITLSNDRMEASWSVNTTSDDDYMGFVFGYQDSQHFYLFDWKKADQNDALGFAQRGMSVKVVNANSKLTGFDLWPSGGNDGRVQVLAHNTIPWVSFTSYKFILTTRPGQFNITVLQGSTVLASMTLQDSTYTSGKFGFYNYSQDSVQYTGFRRTTLQPYTYNIVAIDPENDPLTYSLVNGPAGMAVDPTSGLLSWSVGLQDVGQYPITVKAQEPSGLFDTQSYVLTVIDPASVSPFGAMTLSPATAGPLPVGSSQKLQATLTDGAGAPIANSTITFTVSGANPFVASATTDAAGNASFTYTGAQAGNDTVIATASVSGVTLNSNTSSISWVAPSQPVSSTTILGKFFVGQIGDLRFTATPAQQPAFTQSFPTINFDPQSGTVPGMPCCVGVSTRPFVDITTDSNGNYTGQIIAQGNGLQAGVGSLAAFQAVFTGTFTVAAAGDIQFNFFSDDGFFLGVGNGATRVSGSNVNLPATSPFQNYPVLGGFNAVTAPVSNSITVHFPAPGSYPYELDYFESQGGQLAMTMTAVQTGGHGVPPSGSVTITPNADFTKTIGQTVTFTATVTNASGAIVPNTTILFNVGGANHQQFQTLTNSAGQASFTYTGLTAGVDAVQAQAQVTGMTAVSNQTQITWNSAANTAPVVSAGANQTVTLPVNAVILNGTATDDGLPTGTLATTWSQLSGPNATIENSNQLTTTVLLSQPGSYVFQLTASDSALSRSATVTITLNPPQNQAPSVSISADNTAITLPANTVNLSGTITDDGLPNGAAITSTWSQVSGPATVSFGTPNAAATTAAFSVAGAYVLKLTASDSQLSGSATISITVNPNAPNQAPVVSITADHTTLVLPNNVATLTGKVNDDGLPIGAAISAQWSQVSGPGTVTFSNPTNPSTQVGFPVAGTYQLKLAASDSQLTGTATITITIGAAGQNQAPSVTITADQTTVTLPINTVTLTGIVNDDGLPNGTVSIQWAQTSGPAAVNITSLGGASVKITMPAAGTYVLKLTANDGQLANSATITLTVKSSTLNQPPTVSAGPNQTIQLPQSASLNGYAADDGLPAGSVLSVSWSLVSGPTAVSFSSPTSTVTQATFTQTGTYVLKLTASDSQLQASSQVTVTVNAAPVPPGPPPTVSIDLQNGLDITKPTPINGTISNGHYVVQYAPANADDPAQLNWITFAQGDGPASGVLATFDPTVLLNGSYQVRAVATDAANQSATVSAAVNVSRNLKIGNFTLAFQDLGVPLPGLPIEVVRTYDSRDKAVGDFGVGWTVGVKNVRVQKSGSFGKNWEETVQWSGFFPQYCLQPNNPKFVTITFPDGRVYKFNAVSSPQCQQFVPITAPQIGFQQLSTGSNTAGAKLEPIGDSDFLLDGAVPGPVNIIDFNLEYANYTQFRLTTAEGYVYIVDQKLGATQVTDPNGNTLTINDSGIVHSSGASVAFVRDTQHRITQITDPAQHSISYFYSAAGDLDHVIDRAQQTTTFHYDNHYLTQIDDPRGVQAARNVYDENGRLTDSYDATGVNHLHYDHQVSGNTEIVTDRLGHATTYEYDDDGNVTHKTQIVSGVQLEWTYTYDANGNKLSELLPGHTRSSTFTYDAAGNQLTATDPLGHTTTYTYNARKQVTSIKDANAGAQQSTTSNVYDGKGNLQSSTDGEGHIKSYSYDANGLPKSVSVDNVQIASSVFDGNGNATSRTDANGVTTSYGYDATGNKKSAKVTRTLPDGSKQDVQTTYEYDGNDRPTKTTYPDGSFIQTKYNGLGKPSEVIDALNRSTLYEYDPQGNLVKATYPDQTFEVTEYDAEGRRTSFTDRGNHKITYEYDELGHLTNTHLPDGSYLETVYDAAGRVSDKYDARRNKTHYEYDEADRTIVITDSLQHKTQFFYDNAGRQIAVIDARGNKIQYVYDRLGHIIQTIYPSVPPTSETTHFDSLSRVDFRIDQGGKRTDYGYDSDGRLTSVTQYLNGVPQTTRYTYDEVGNRVTQTDVNNHTTKYEYNNMRRRVRRTLPLGQSESYTYDAAGNLKTRTSFNGRTTTYDYDQNNRLASKTADPYFSQNNLGASQVSFTYSATGKRLTMTDATGTTSYTYDPQTDRLLSKATPFGTLSYGYDVAGNLLSIQSSNANGVAVSYTYDALNRLATVIDGAGTSSYSYDAAGNLERFTYPNGVIHSYSYDTLNRLNNLTEAKASDCSSGANICIASYRYTLGPTGRRLSVAELSGRVINYGYDDLYRVTSEAITADPNGQNGTVSYSYDRAGNRTQLTSSLSSIPSSGLMTYDANDRSSTDQYDDDGNTIVSSSITNTYDFEGHLLQRGNIKIVYDGDGNRVAETVGGVTTQYLVSEVNPTRYPQVLEELQNGAVTRKYTYGLEMIDESQLISGGWQVSFYGYDGHGSVRNLTDVAGNVTDTYQYDVFGNLIRLTGSTPNLYLFAGQQFDSALGLYYSRARYLNVSTGRFITADAYEGNEEDAVSLHRYLYAGNDPANRIDPSGNFDIGDALAVSAIVGVLTSIATILYGQYVYRSKIDPKDRGNIIQRHIFPFYAGFGFKCNQWIGTLANPPVDRARPDMRHHGKGFFGSAFRGEVYEIKPNNPTQVALGFDEVQNFYIPRLDAHDQANGITTPWHPGTHLLAPPRMRIPEFPFIVFRLSIPVEGVVAYDPEADIEEAAKWGIAAFAITFFALTLKIDTPVPKPQPVPEPVPEPEPVPLPDAA